MSKKSAELLTSMIQEKTS